MRNVVLLCKFDVDVDGACVGVIIEIIMMMIGRIVEKSKRVIANGCRLLVFGRAVDPIEMKVKVEYDDADEVRRRATEKLFD